MLVTLYIDVLWRHRAGWLAGARGIAIGLARRWMGFMTRKFVASETALSVVSERCALMVG